jgi:hypothetical protein
LGKFAAAARQLIADRFLLASDLPDLLDQALVEYDWASRADRK